MRNLVPELGSEDVTKRGLLIVLTQECLKGATDVRVPRPVLSRGVEVLERGRRRARDPPSGERHGAAGKGRGKVALLRSDLEHGKGGLGVLFRPDALEVAVCEVEEAVVIPSALRRGTREELKRSGHVLLERFPPLKVKNAEPVERLQVVLFCGSLVHLNSFCLVLFRSLAFEQHVAASSHCDRIPHVCGPLEIVVRTSLVAGKAAGSVVVQVAHREHRGNVAALCFLELKSDGIVLVSKVAGHNRVLVVRKGREPLHFLDRLPSSSVLSCV